ncbi:DUF3298 and DUF4163 domain-containing protein [Myroides guanonis]|uniref:DUF3298 domain-containing protein n=1 Tax=Myroides guanonis TaxID=1150112 RepID=A0A1I3MXE9_9FLAO|nr:DUF3298 and DUF4163 domain-containing protein [Myroides guanonis]SFJ01668.1 Protein of unknown function [Myroides guanonis]
MRGFGLAFFIVFLLVGCSKSQELKVEQQEYYKKSSLPCSDHRCTEVSISIPFVVEPKGKIADSINGTLFSKVAEIISFEELPSLDNGYNSIADSFVKSYDDVKRDFPQEGAPWEANVKGKVIMQKTNLFSIELDHYVFSGGAHGYRGIQVYHFDPRTGKQYSIDDLLVDKVGFSKLVEKRLREKWDIAAGVPINSTGLMFENDVFALPLNIFIYPDKVVAYYNVYEIASYADGPTEIVFTNDEVQPFMTVFE